MKKSYFFTHKGYIFTSIILISVNLTAFILPLISLIQNYYNQTSAKLIIIMITFAFLIFFIITFGFTFIQWVEIDGKKIIARSLFKIILEVDWSNIKEIYIDNFAYSHNDVFLSKWIVFDDGRKNTIRGNGLNVKRSFVKVKYSEKNIKIIKSLWEKDILENNINIL